MQNTTQARYEVLLSHSDVDGLCKHQITQQALPQTLQNVEGEHYREEEEELCHKSSLTEK